MADLFTWLIWEVSSHAEINARLSFVHYYPPVSTTRYSFIQLRELEQCGADCLRYRSVSSYLNWGFVALATARRCVMTAATTFALPPSSPPSQTLRRPPGTARLSSRPSSYFLFFGFSFRSLCYFSYPIRKWRLVGRRSVHHTTKRVIKYSVFYTWMWCD